MPDTPTASATLRFPERIAYVVSHSYPYSSNGYAVRTHEVAKALTQRGHDVVVFNRPGRPWDIEGFPADEVVASEQKIDGVRYIFLPTRTTPDDKLRPRLREAERVLMEAFEIFRPGMVLAVSNWENAEPAQNAARRFGCAFYYEQRGFWEMSRAGADTQDRELATRDRQNEVRIAKAARAVFTLNAGMRNELVSSGVPAEKIHLVPNGVGQPGKLSRGVTRSTMGITAKHLLGYIGSLSEYEGVEDILHLQAHLRGEGVDVDSMIVGSSAPKGLIASRRVDPQEQKLRDLARQLGLEAQVHFVPQVPWDQTGAYYSMCDAIILPRRRQRMTELVAPLKPYAAAAYSVPVFMTDMPPLDEIARDIHASLFKEGDIPALAQMVRAALTNGHPALTEPLRPGVLWPRRVRPMSDLLSAEGRAVHRDMQDHMPTGSSSDGGFSSHQTRFDLAVVPQVALSHPVHVGTVVCVGPGKTLEGDKVIRASRQSLLAALGGEVPGVFLIDWPGIQADADSEWAGLWSISNMRLNRQIMDACRIALDRGWQIRVLGPVHRSMAPLYRTVAEVVEEVDGNVPQNGTGAEASPKVDPETEPKAAPETAPEARPKAKPRAKPKAKAKSGPKSGEDAA